MGWLAVCDPGQSLGLLLSPRRPSIPRRSWSSTGATTATAGTKRCTLCLSRPSTGPCWVSCTAMDAALRTTTPRTRLLTAPLRPRHPPTSVARLHPHLCRRQARATAARLLRGAGAIPAIQWQLSPGCHLLTVLYFTGAAGGPVLDGCACAGACMFAHMTAARWRSPHQRPAAHCAFSHPTHRCSPPLHSPDGAAAVGRRQLVPVGGAGGLGLGAGPARAVVDHADCGGAWHNGAPQARPARLVHTGGWRWRWRMLAEGRRWFVALAFAAAARTRGAPSALAQRLARAHRAVPPGLPRAPCHRAWCWPPCLSGSSCSSPWASIAACMARCRCGAAEGWRSGCNDHRAALGGAPVLAAPHFSTPNLKLLPPLVSLLGGCGV